MNKFVYLDVGSAGGIPIAYRAASLLRKAVLLLADPQPDWRSIFPIWEYAGCDVRHIPYALGAESGEHDLYVTRAPGCSSCLPPDEGFLSRFPVREWFEVMRVDTVQVKTYFEVSREMELPAPDIVKIDVQGFELSVLEGMGPLLDGVTCVELETCMEALYVGQPLLGSVHAFMRSRGFVLRDLKPQGVFEGQALEFNAFWSREQKSNRQEEIERFWRKTHKLWAGDFFDRANPLGRKYVRFNR